MCLANVFGAVLATQEFPVDEVVAGDAIVNPERMRAIVTLSAVALGFSLSQLSEFIKSRKSAAAKRRAVRCLIGLEMNNNIARIKAFGNLTLSKASSNEKSDIYYYDRLAAAVGRSPDPMTKQDLITQVAPRRASRARRLVRIYQSDHVAQCHPVPERPFPA